MEDRWARVVDALLVLVLVDFAAALVNTLFRHICASRADLTSVGVVSGALVEFAHKCYEAPNILEVAVRQSASVAEREA